MFKLILKKTPNIYLDLEILKPEELETMSLSEVLKLPIRVGNSEVNLEEFFEVEEISGEKLVMVGDLSRTRNLGWKMREGKIIVEGNAGMHLGCQMKGGEILVKGSADSWIGCEMRGGGIEILGDAGDYVGSGYRGSEGGMRGGEIKIRGSAGDFVGEFLAGGVIEVSQNAGIHAGSNMRGGEIRIGGVATIPGGGMKGGVMRIERVDEMLPTFKKDAQEGDYFVFSGDYAVNGKGRIYVKRIED